MNNHATQLPTPRPADRGAPPFPKGAKKRYRAARIAPVFLCLVFPLAGEPLGFGLGSYFEYPFVILLFSTPLVVSAFVFCFAPVAKWRVSRKHHISYPIAILCAIDFLYFIAMHACITISFADLFIIESWHMGKEAHFYFLFNRYIVLEWYTILQPVLGVLIAGAQAICFAVQYHLGKKYPQILEAESVELKRLEEKYYFGGNSHVEM